MTGFRLSPEVEAEAELDGIWIHIARECSSIDVATRVVENISERFWLPARYPYMGRRRDDYIGPDLHSFAADGYVIMYRPEEDDLVLVLHVVHGSAISPRFLVIELLKEIAVRLR